MSYFRCYFKTRSILRVINRPIVSHAETLNQKALFARDTLKLSYNNVQLKKFAAWGDIPSLAVEGKEDEGEKGQGVGVMRRDQRRIGRGPEFRTPERPNPAIGDLYAYMYSGGCRGDEGYIPLHRPQTPRSRKKLICENSKFFGVSRRLLFS